jgi:hypothetical protein
MYATHKQNKSTMLYESSLKNKFHKISKKLKDFFDVRVYKRKHCS